MGIVKIVIPSFPAERSKCDAPESCRVGREAQVAEVRDAIQASINDRSRRYADGPARQALTESTY